jgi:hypothetical protein
MAWGVALKIEKFVGPFDLDCIQDIKDVYPDP